MPSVPCRNPGGTDSFDPKHCSSFVDEDAVNARKIKSAVTDSDRDIRFDPEAKPGVSNPLTLQQALTGSDMDRIVEGYADKGYGDLKTETAQIVLDAVGPIRARTREFLDDPGELTRIVHQGAEKARAAATSTLEAVYKKVGFVGD